MGRQKEREDGNKVPVACAADNSLLLNFLNHDIYVVIQGLMVASYQ